MTIKIIEKQELWDEFVDGSPYGLLFHKWKFLKIIEKHTNYKLLSYGIYKGDTLICIFPLFYNKVKFIKMIFSPPPQTGVPYLGFVVNQDYDILKEDKKWNLLNIIANEISEQIKKFSPNYISISTVPNFLDIRSFKWNDYNVYINFAYSINLNQTPNEIWNAFKKNTRYQIKKGISLNLKLIKSDDFSVFFEVLKRRYEEQSLNLPIISKNYLEDLIEAFPDNLGLYYLYDNNNNIISTTLNCEYKHKYIGWMGGVKPHEKYFANELINWELILKAKKAGYKEYEISGAGVKGICEFYSKFNPYLNFNYILMKKDNLGKIAEWAYLNFIKKK